MAPPVFAVPPTVPANPNGTGPIPIVVGRPAPLPMEHPGTGPTLSPALEINPIGTAYRPVSRLASLGLSTVVWGLLGGACFLAYRMQAIEKGPAYLPTQMVDLQLTETDTPTLDGGGHQGGGMPPPRASEPDPTTPPPPPLQRDFPTDVPVPNTLPTEALLAPPAPQAMGVLGGTGTGNGYGTGPGSGTGTGSGTGSGNGTGDGIQTPNAPLVVPYSQISIVKAVNPEYPEKARRKGLQGQAVVRVTIDENGVPFEFHVVGGEEHFVKETLKVLPHWRFTPVTRMGKRVRATFDAVINFSLA